MSWTVLGLRSDHLASFPGPCPPPTVDPHLSWGKLLSAAGVAPCYSEEFRAFLGVGVLLLFSQWVVGSSKSPAQPTTSQVFFTLQATLWNWQKLPS